MHQGPGAAILQYAPRCCCCEHARGTFTSTPGSKWKEGMCGCVDVWECATAHRGGLQTGLSRSVHSRRLERSPGFAMGPPPLSALPFAHRPLPPSRCPACPASLCVGRRHDLPLAHQEAPRNPPPIMQCCCRCTLCVPSFDHAKRAWANWQRLTAPISTETCAMPPFTAFPDA